MILEFTAAFFLIISKMAFNAKKTFLELHFQNFKYIFHDINVISIYNKMTRNLN